LRRPVIGADRPKHVFITENGDWPAYSDRSEFRLFSCDGLVCTNPEYFDRNRQRFRCELIANGVDLETFRPGMPERERFGLGQSDRVVLMVSALIPSKNVADGIEAVARLPDTKLVVAGDGPLRDDIGILADQLLPGRFLRLTVPMTDMPALYRSADAFMHLSVDESFGNVFVEAIASGLPVVAYDSPRTRWIVGNNGHFAKERSAEALVAALQSGLEASDAERASAREAAHAFAWSRIGAQYESFFASLLEPS
jgi:glycosyltransferase involved in cell wall biosynthesis